MLSINLRSLLLARVLTGLLTVFFVANYTTAPLSAQEAADAPSFSDSFPDHSLHTFSDIELVYSVEVGPNGNIYVPDYRNLNIQVYNNQGSLINTIAPSSGDGVLTAPKDIVFSSTGDMYVADGYFIKKYDSNGNYVSRWGGMGAGDGFLNNPFGLAIDSNDNIYVADFLNYRVQKFDSNGTFLTKWGTQGAGNAQFNRPYQIVVDGEDNVYVSDTVNQRIQKFDSSGTYLLQWGSSGTGDGQFDIDFAGGLGVDSENNIYVGDMSNERVQVFDKNGNFVKKWSIFESSSLYDRPKGLDVDGSGNVYVAIWDHSQIHKYDTNGSALKVWGAHHASSNEGFLYNPSGIAEDSQGNIYVTDGNNNKVVKYNSQGDYLETWGSEGAADGQFYYPQGIAIDSNDRVFIADTWNYRIQYFDSSGNFLGKIEKTGGGWGSGNGEFLDPMGVAFDSQNNLYVAEEGNHRVQKFDSSLNYVSQWGSSGNGDGQFSYPRDIQVDSSDVLYVADAGNDRIQKFDTDGTFIAKWGVSGSGNGEFMYPVSIGIDNVNNWIYVGDGNLSNPKDPQRIQKFDLTGQYLASYGQYGYDDEDIYFVDGILVSSSEKIYASSGGDSRIIILEYAAPEGGGQVPGDSPQPTPTPSPIEIQSISSSNSGGNSSSCTLFAPKTSPLLFQIDRFGTSATLYFVPVLGSVNSYYIMYAPATLPAQHATSFNYSDTSGVIPFTIHDLNPNINYWFKVSAKNGCAVGPWSMPLLTSQNFTPNSYTVNPYTFQNSTQAPDTSNEMLLMDSEPQTSSPTKTVMPTPAPTPVIQEAQMDQPSTFMQNILQKLQSLLGR